MSSQTIPSRDHSEQYPSGVLLTPTPDEGLMSLALDEARQAEAEGEVPVGALVVVGREIVAADHNRREQLQDPTAHAELLALRAAASRLGSWRLVDASLYVTLEPCPMCAGAAVAARIRRVVFGAADPKAGACGSLYNLCSDPRLNHEPSVVPGVLESACAAGLKQYFHAHRH